VPIARIETLPGNQKDAAGMTRGSGKEASSLHSTPPTSSPSNSCVRNATLELDCWLRRRLTITATPYSYCYCYCGCYLEEWHVPLPSRVWLSAFVVAIADWIACAHPPIIQFVHAASSQAVSKQQPAKTNTSRVGWPSNTTASDRSRVRKRSAFRLPFPFRAFVSQTRR
jgi:hypothetical protein